MHQNLVGVWTCDAGHSCGVGEDMNGTSCAEGREYVMGQQGAASFSHS